MKLISQDWIDEFAVKIDARTNSESTDLLLNFSFDLKEELEKAIEFCETNIITFRKVELDLQIWQRDLIKSYGELIDTIEVNAWDQGNIDATKVVLCSEMDHQRLSNIIGLLEILFAKGRINEKRGNYYLSQIENNIVPELEARFGGEVLPYVPFYEWEKKLMEQE
jgi:hypothetical protein